MNSGDQAIDCYKKGFSCAQAVLSAYSERFGLDRETALRVAGAFGGGIARMGETCGVVTGAFMVIGLKHGKFSVDDKKATEKTYELANELAARFKRRNGSILCRDLLRHDVSTAEGRKAVAEKKLFVTLCAGFVKDATEILDEML